jgi:hypothetical protein
VDAGDYVPAIGIAIFSSLILAAVEIQHKSQMRIRACFVLNAALYWSVVAFGNAISTVLALAVVQKTSVPASLYWLVTPFFGVFAFEAVFKNTNVTIGSQGVLTIKDWTDKALNIAAAAAIRRDQDIEQNERQKLASQLMPYDEAVINGLVLIKMGQSAVLQLDADANASQADTKFYKVHSLVTVLTPAERRYWMNTEAKNLPDAVARLPIR